MLDSQLQARFTAAQVYEIIKPYSLTAEQAAAVEQASTTDPSLIVAGAGSGKTELMSVRVLWLVANGFARPDQILGLTFTRKAASELGKRVFESLLKLRDSELWPEELDYDFIPPTISTYNAYANNLFRDFALAIGHEPDAALLTEGAAFGLARELILTQGANVDSRLADLDKTPDAMVELVLAMAQEMSDNLASASMVEAAIGEVFEALTDLPKKVGSADSARFAYIDEIAAKLNVSQTIAKLAEEFILEKQRLGYVDYSDQIALAELASRQVPQARERERATFTQVLLDEYQDTSYLQARLLRGLFADSAVYAVGDPNQSIYGWRGASSSNLQDFAGDFCSEPARVRQFSLSTSWRNPSSVLQLANLLAEPLASPAGYSRATAGLKPVKLVAQDGAEHGAISINFSQDVQQEAKDLAAWFKSNSNSENTSALLLRNRANMGLIAETLQDAGLAVEVVGLGGLLEMPEIVDLVSALRVINSPQSGSALIRLLAGPRWRIGPKDLQRLAGYANSRAQSFDAELNRKIRSSLAVEDSPSIVDALDALIDEKSPEKIGFSDVTLSRLINAAELLRKLRRQEGLGLAEFVRAVEQELWLDIEVMANPKLRNPMANLNAFAAIVTNYSSSNHRPTLHSFLTWLDFADQREKFEVPSLTPEKGVVQILTVHAAKGLEWHNVAIANLNEGDFPSDRGASTGWSSAGVLPYPLRGDRESLPEWNFKSAQTQPEFKSSLEQFKLDSKEHKLREETRLIYVAVTRPKQNLLLSGSFWKPGVKTAKQPSRFLQVAADFLGQALPELAAETNPLDTMQTTATWPLEPLGDQYRALLTRAAETFDQAQNSLAAVPGAPSNFVSEQIELLLLEQAERNERVGQVVLPVRIAASRFKDFISDLDQLAERQLRPMPAQPFAQTRSGTLFHTWLEQNFASGIELFSDSENASADPDGMSALGSIDQLKQNFRESRWADLQPISVEQEIQLTRGAHTFICKLDAVFEVDGQIQIVDWKTGKPPKDKRDEELKSLQLALYRAAYAQFAGISTDRITASFYFVSENSELTPSKLLEPDELFELWDKTLEEFVL